jgi:hypothetical protein
MPFTLHSITHSKSAQKASGDEKGVEVWTEIKEMKHPGRGWRRTLFSVVAV